MKAPKKSDNTLWLSRVSFFVSAVALVSVGYRSVSERLPTDTEAPLADAASRPPKAPLLMGFAHSTGLSKVASSLTDASNEPTGDNGEAEGNASRPPGLRLPSGETFRAAVRTHATNLGIRVKRLVVTQAVEDREPVEVQEVSPSTPVIAFVEVVTDGREDQNVVVTFEHETGDRVGLVNLNVPGNKARWRTWGRTYDVNRDGRWTAVVRDSRGEELGRTAFTVRGTS
jgi:hypothetical protein